MYEKECSLCGKIWPCGKPGCVYRKTEKFPTPSEPIKTGGGLDGTGLAIGAAIVGGLMVVGYINHEPAGDSLGHDGFVYSAVRDTVFYDLEKKKIGTLEAGSCVIGIGVGTQGSILEGYRYLEVRTPARYNGVVDGKSLKYQEDWGTANCSASLSSEGLSVYKVFNESKIYYASASDTFIDDAYLPAGSCIMVDESQVADKGRVRALLKSSEQDYARSYAQPLYIDRENTRPMGIFDLDCLGYYFSQSVAPTEWADRNAQQSGLGAPGARFAQVWRASPAL